MSIVFPCSKDIPPQKVLVTGATGYIGSHTVVQLMNAGTSVVMIDNLSNSKSAVVERIKAITGLPPQFLQGDIRDRKFLRSLLSGSGIDAVIHFAGLKSVSESEADPLKYYDNNVAGSIVLFEEVLLAGIKKIVFSSSATVYGVAPSVMYSENFPLTPINVYGRTKLMVEDILRDLKKTNPELCVALLRYFNPVGAHASGLIGEDPFGIPNNLMPFIAQVAVGSREKLTIFGNDYPTYDGTGLRDYIHVEDLAAGHLAALSALERSLDLITVNLGTGRPYSVLDLVKAFERASHKNISYEIASRRAGDLAEYYADASLAKEILGWEAKLGIDEMCSDVWRWQSMNPSGYS